MNESFLAEQHRECWGALDFLDDHMQPTTKTVVIESVGTGKPPGGGDDRPYFICKGDKRKMFLKNSARIFIAYKLGTKANKDIVGCALKITVQMAQSPKGGKVFSMTVVDAVYPKSRQQSAQSIAEQTKQREPGED